VAAKPVLAGWFPAIVNTNYTHVWALANLLLVLILTVNPIGQRGQRVLVTYVLQLALLGSFLAVVFSSAGPVYYARVVGGPNPYADLVPSLVRQLGPSRALSALDVQAYLWREHLSGNVGPTTGISAFPSMHVASSTLIALALGSWRRWAGTVGWAFVGLIMFGSVYLGWHYAVDGYASIVLTLALWWVAGRMTRV
jgi:membrane-associated phospholipid phosphatase